MVMRLTATGFLCCAHHVLFWTEKSVVVPVSLSVLRSHGGRGPLDIANQSLHNLLLVRIVAGSKVVGGAVASGGPDQRVAKWATT